MIRKECLVYLIWILGVSSCGSPIPDEIESQQRTEEQSQINLVLDKSELLLNSGVYDNVPSLLDSAEKLALKSGDSIRLASTLNNRGVLYYRLGDYDQSIKCYSEALELAVILKDSLNIGSRLKNIGMSLKQKGMYNASIRNYREALSIFYRLGDVREIGSVYNSIGNIYKRLNEYESALNMYTEAQQNWEQDSYEKGIAIILGNRGNTLLEIGRIDEAVDCYSKALSIKEEIGNLASISITLNNLGEAYLKLGQFEKSYHSFSESLEIKESVGDKKGVALVSNNFGSLELDRGNLNRAQFWIFKADKLIKEIGASDLQLENIRLKKHLYVKKGDFKKVFKIDEYYDKVRDLAFKDQILKVQELQAKYDLEQEEEKRRIIQNELDIANVKAENEQIKSQIQQYIIIAAVLTIFIISYFAYSLRKKNRHIENLIRELHHRVKNHLGMISGMFGAQTGLSIADSAVLDEAKTRVEAVNGIHRRLYRQDEYEFVNMKEYLEELVDNNAMVFGLFNKIEKHLEINQQILDIDKAISVGLIANEVLTNAFKYGLGETKQPVLKIILEKAIKGYRMVIFNNASSDKSKGGGFGGELVNRLAQNLKGQIQIIKEGGFQFELTFP